MIVLDEYGDPWEVLRGDPAYTPIQLLLRVGIRPEGLVLPQIVLLTGRLPDSYHEPEPPDTSDKDRFLMWCRLSDSCASLRFML